MTVRRGAVLRTLTLTLVAAVAACGDPDEPPVDAGTDAGVDSGNDAGVDADRPHGDATPEADVEEDAEADVEVDADEDVPVPSRAAVAVGGSHCCALAESGAVRCWGEGDYGQHGHGHRNAIGDDETPASAGDVDLGGPALQISAGDRHTCAVLEGGSVRCWGTGDSGILGYGNTSDIGDDETPASAGDVDVGGAVAQVAAGGLHTCALLESGDVRCWGVGAMGRLGRGDEVYIGDDEAPATSPVVDVGGVVRQITAGSDHTCALLESGAVRCWGGGRQGALGYGSTEDIGDDEPPAAAGDVSLGGAARAVVAWGDSTCALMESGDVRCWGAGASGQLGLASTASVGDDELPSSVAAVAIGGAALALAAGYSHVCALLSGGAVRCWGLGIRGQLGYGNRDNVGDDEAPSTAGDVGVGGPAVAIAAGGSQTCALLGPARLRCWGSNGSGALGYGHTDTVGDDETPASAGDVPVW